MPLVWGDADIFTFLGDQLASQGSDGGGLVVVALSRESRELT